MPKKTFWSVALKQFKRIKKIKRTIRTAVRYFRIRHKSKVVWRRRLQENIFRQSADFLLAHFGRRQIAALLVIAIVLSSFAFFKDHAQAATYTFTQSSWTGGVTANMAAHNSNQNGWTQYGAGGGVTAGATVSLPSTSYTLTDDSAISSAPASSVSGGGFGNGSNSNTTVTGSTSVGLTPTLNQINAFDVDLTVVPSNVGAGASIIRNGSDDEMYMLRGSGTGFSKYTISTDTWTSLTNIPGSVGAGSTMIRNGSSNDIYVTRGNNTDAFYKYSISGNSWTTLAVVPNTVNTGGLMIRNGSDNEIYVLRGNSTAFYRYSISGNSWTTLAVLPASVGAGSAMLRNSSDNEIYVLQGNNGTGLYSYSISGDSWSTLTVVPGAVFSAGTMIRDGSSNDIYILRGGGTTSFYKYSISGNSYTTLTVVPGTVSTGGGMVRDASSNDIYVLRGNNTSVLFKYSISGNSWTTLTSGPYPSFTNGFIFRSGSSNTIYVLPGNTTAFAAYSISGNSWTGSVTSSAPLGVELGGKMIRNGSDDDVYVLQGNSGTGFYRYSVSGNSWTTLAVTPAAIGTGATMIRNGSDDHIYVLRGNITTAFYRYSISGNSWTTLTVTPATIDGGSFMIRNGSDNDIYVARGGSTTAFYRYSISGNSWATLTVVPAAIGLGSAVTRNGSSNDIYVLRGAGSTALYKYSISGDSWATMAVTPGALSVGTSMIRNGSDNDIYVTQGGNTGFYRYSISGDSWATLTAIPAASGNGGAMVRDSSSNDIYVLSGSSINFYKYSISGNSWTTLATLPSPVGDGGGMIRNGSDQELYVLQGAAGGAFYKFVITTTTYPSSGTFTSAVIDMGGFANYSSIAHAGTSTFPTGTSMTFNVRAGNTASPDGTWTAYTTGIASGGSISAFNGYRYIQYQLALATSVSTVSPTINQVDAAFSQYAFSGTLTSSVYDSSSGDNLIGKVAWTATNASATELVKFQVRTSSDGNTWSNWCGYSSCTGSSFFLEADNDDIISGGTLQTGSNDRYFQYLLTLVSGGAVTPILNSAAVSYVVNTPPEFDTNYPTAAAGGASAVQNSNGTVTINYSVRDPDGNTGTSTPGFITPSFEYSLDNGSTWSPVSNTYLGASDYTNKAVDTVTYNQYSATWNVTGQFTGQYDTDAKIRVTINDNESANNTATATTAAFTLDTKDPALGVIPISIDASQSTPLVTLSATDDTTLQMKVGTTSDLSGFSYEAYAGTKTISISSGDTVYAQFKDAKGNDTAILSVTPPAAVSNIFFQDTSNSDTEEWREFFAWGMSDVPTLGFKQYNVYRSVNGAPFTLYTTITNRMVNYMVDSALDTLSTYQYKVSVQDDNDNISFFSNTSPVDNPDGTGGSDLTSPVLSAVAASNVTATSATITWTTDKLSNSSVYFLPTGVYPGDDKADYDDSTGIPSMVLSHSVVLSNLDPGTQYFFLAESEDISSNTGESASALYTFTTDDGPVISNVTTSQIFDTEATITWNTNIVSDSTVFYSVNADLSSPTEVAGPVTLVTNHRVDVPNLTSGTKYYYYVESVDSLANLAVDKNVIDGTIEYFTFNTSSDSSAPTISDVETSLVGETGATITWATDESSTSQVEWGLTDALGTYTVVSGAYSTQHAVVITGLDSETEYFYRVISEDRAGNVSSDDDGGNTYTFTTSSPTTITVGGGGGGGSTLDNRDLTVPVISDVKVASLGSTSATITFKTSKVANGKIDYGATTTYGQSVDKTDQYGLSHTISLTGLTASSKYHFRITSADVYDNTAVAPDAEFTTLITGAAPEVSEDSLEAFLASFSRDQLTSALTNLAARVAEGGDGSIVISGPDISVEVTADSATIEWVTDKAANSLVAYADESDYSVSDKSYSLTVGSTDEHVLRHKVVIENLAPTTTYHYQVVSKDVLGPVAVSKDDTFTTLSLTPDINNVRISKLDETSATLLWKTDLPTKSLFELRNTTTGSVKKLEDPSYLKDHDFTLNDLDDSTGYNLTIKALDSDGNSSDSLAVSFNTPLSTEAPKISNVKISTSIIPDRAEITQTIISWKTDKPATSQIFFTEGTSSDLKQSTTLDESVVRDHIVITTLMRPGLVYKIAAESSNVGGDVTRSDPYTVLTPKPRSSVVDLIFENFSKTFGFLKR